MSYLLQQLLTESAEKNPNKIAVVHKNNKITYSELDIVTNQLSNRLLSEGVKKGDRVGFYLNKSIESIISIFAILKAGGVYVPLDPLTPTKRVSYMIRDCGIRCLITSCDKLIKIESIFRDNSPLSKVIVTDNGIDTLLEKLTNIKYVKWQEILDSELTHMPDVQNINTDLGYILYTSGSTGDPKGVMISHLNALTFINWSFKQFHIQQTDRVSNHAPLHFDLSIFDIFTTLKACSTLFLVPDQASIFAKMLIEFIQDNEITVWYSVPSILIYLLIHGNLKKYRFPNLRLILFAGEVFPIKYLRELMEIIPHADYYNLYGPTETNVCTYYHVKEIEQGRIKPIPIGKACSNIEVFALDENGEVVTKHGQEGELYVRGSCVAKGYWGDPEKSQTTFVRNFLRTDFEEKMYLTGDIVTRDEKGDCHLIGRRDHMIKSRGYRIELGEIESVLYSHQNVNEVGVVAIPDEYIGNRIKAFIVLVNTESITKVDLKKYCAERMPRYMIPEEIEFCETLPKTSTGKIDRKSLINKTESNS